MSHSTTPIHRGQSDFDISRFPQDKKIYAIVFGEAKRQKGNTAVFLRDPKILLGRRKGEKAFTLVEISTNNPYLSFFTQTLGLFGFPQNNCYGAFSNDMSYIILKLTSANPFELFPKQSRYRERCDDLAFRQRMQAETADWDRASPTGGTAPDVLSNLSGLFEPFEEIAYAYLGDLINIRPPPSSKQRFIDTRSDYEKFVGKYFNVGVGQCYVTYANAPAPTEFKTYDRSTYPPREIDINPDILEAVRDAHGHYLRQFMGASPAVNRK